MHSYKENFRAVLLALLLLFLQNAGAVHALDHEINDHPEWCQLLANSDTSSVLVSAQELSLENVSQQDRPAIFKQSFRSVEFLHYPSRGPPSI